MTFAPVPCIIRRLLYEAIVFSQPHYRLVFCFAPYAARFRLQVVADVTTGSTGDNACP
ncbi:hypothetical protein [Conchiformibius steedae]|uniref:hypothetical protein n=1 Tax=Conchiformibius steedae TaxID=153493 RepID=UPI00163A2F0B|nr:hypothetical protein [Conchiformibius steedae]